MPPLSQARHAERSVPEVVRAMRSLERSYLLGVEGVTEVWLVRHADVYDGLMEVEDPPLSETGWKQARRLAERIRRVEVEAVYASPARRAQETARGLAAAVQTDTRLAEAAATFSAGRVRIVEGATAVIERMRAAVDDAAAAHPGGRVVMVSHGIAIIDFLADVLRLEPRTLRLYPPYTGVSIVRIKDSQRAAGTLFDVAHLETMG
jgi:broad specificity phosphatase PhoE